MPLPDLPALRRLRPHAFAIAAAALLALVSAGAWGHATMTEPRWTVVEEQSVQWREVATLHHRALVTKGSDAWPENTLLQDVSGGYFLNVAPRAYVDFAWRHTGDPELRGDAVLTMYLRVQDAKPDGGAYWTIQQTLAQTSRSAGADEEVVVMGSFDVTALLERVRGMDATLGGHAGKITYDLLVDVTFYPSGNGDQAQHSTYRIPILVREPVYVLPVEGDAQWTRDHGQSTPVRVPLPPPGWRALLDRPHVLGMGALGAAGLALAIAARLAPPDTLAARHARELATYREWIVEAAGAVVPDESTRQVEVKSLESLAHLAAESRTRIIADTPRHAYYVLAPGVTYRYTAPATPAVPEDAPAPPRGASRGSAIRQRFIPFPPVVYTRAPAAPPPLPAEAAPEPAAPAEAPAAAAPVPEAAPLAPPEAAMPAATAPPAPEAASEAPPAAKPTKPLDDIDRTLDALLARWERVRQAQAKGDPTRRG